MTAEHEARIPFITPQAAGEQVGKNGNWMYRKALAGRLPHHKLGNQVMFCGGCLEEIARSSYQPGETKTPPPAAATKKTPPGATARRFDAQKQRKPRPRPSRPA